MPKVSVLIPIYNVEKYLRQCLNSVVNQTLEDIEIICINDGSTDSSLNIISDYAKAHNNIKIINKKNTGYGHSMNCGLKLAKGEYIGIVESDDFADLNMFKTLYNKAKSCNAEVLKASWFRQIGDNAIFTKLSNLPYDQIFVPRIEYPQIFSPPIAIWSAIYKREFLLKNDIYFNETPGASYQDVSFVFKVWSCAERVILIKDGFLHYRIDNPNSSVKSKEKAYCIFDEFKEINRFLKNRHDIYDPCIYITEPVKFKHYLSNYKRIDDIFKFNFLEHMYEEFKNDNEIGHLNKDYWQEENWQKLEFLLNNKKGFFYKQYEENQNVHLYKYGVYSLMKHFKKIYIYGAGVLAALALYNLIKNQFNVSKILVSDINDNPNKLLGVEVTHFDNFLIDKEQDLILIAVNEKIQYDILYKLQKEGYKNIIVMTTGLQRVLTR